MASIEERHRDARFIVVATPPAPTPPERSADRIAKEQAKTGGAP